MLYTSGVFESEEDSLEQAQDNKMIIASNKIHLKEGERLLDIGCGWGTYACFVADRFKVKATGVTVSSVTFQAGMPATIPWLLLPLASAVNGPAPSLIG